MFENMSDTDDDGSIEEDIVITNVDSEDELNTPHEDEEQFQHQDNENEHDQVKEQKQREEETAGKPTTTHSNATSTNTPIPDKRPRRTKPNNKTSGTAHVKTATSKKQTIAQIRALNVRATALERDLSSRLLRFRMVEGRDQFKALERLRADADMKRVEEKATLMTELKKTNANIKHFRSMLQRVNSAPSFVDQVQRVVEHVETSMLILKAQQREIYEGLVAQEKMLGRELIAQQETFDSWEKIGLPGMIKAAQRKGGMPPRAGAGKAGEDLPEAARLTSYLRKHGGLTGGWSEYDHGVFMRERQRASRVDTALETTASKLVGKNSVDCQEHEKWYTEFLRLTEAKRVAIRKWKAQKATQLEAQAHARARDIEKQEQVEDARLEALKLKRQERVQAKAEQVARWKAEKAEREAEHEKRVLQQQQAEALAMKRLEQERHEAQKAKVQDYMEKKKQQDAHLVAAAERTHAANIRRVTKAELAHFRERDERHFQEQLAKRHEAAENEKKRLLRLENLRKQVRVEVQRDPSRLTRPTAASLSREKDTTTAGGQIHIAPPKRAVPSWRQR